MVISVISLSLGNFWFFLEDYWESFDFDVGFVGNSGSFFLFLFAGEIDSIGIFKF